MKFDIRSALQSTRAKFTAVTMIIVAIVTIALTVVSSILISSTSYKSSLQLIKPLEIQVSNNLQVILEDTKQISNSVANNEGVKNGFKVSVKPALKNVITQGKALNCAMFNLDGTVFAANDTALEHYSGSNLFNKAVAGEEVFSDPYTAETGLICVDLLTPVINQDKVVYVIILTYDFTKVDNLLDSFTFGNTGVASIINTENVLVAGKGDRFTNYNEAVAQVNKLKSIVEFYNKAINANEYGTGEYTSPDGKDMLGCYAPIEGTDWILVLGAEKKEFAGTSLGGIFITMGIGIILMIAAFIFTMRMVDNVMRPVSASSQRLKALSNGDISSPVSTVFGSDEISVLSRSLDETVSALRLYIHKIDEGLNAIAQGNLTYSMEGDWRGDFISIKTTFNSILESLRTTFSNINSAAKQVNEGATQVSSGAQTLSQGATEQSTAISQLASQLEDISSQVEANAKAASNTSTIVEKNVQNIDICNREMNKMLVSMDEIKKSSNEISKIIKVIDDIAFQTNILALNAAVEAARAGEAGKGFAVVADEVRNLAAKSAEAANQTTSLIEQSISAVNNGASIAKKTAGALNEIVASSKAIAQEVGHITEASAAQAESINQINVGVDQISTVTQNNTATAEESAAASEELSGQSDMLTNLISQFKYDGVVKKDSDEIEDDYFLPSSNNFSSTGNSTSSNSFEPQDNGFGSSNDSSSLFEPQDNGFDSSNDSSSLFEPEDNGFGSSNDSSSLFEPQDNGFKSVDFDPKSFDNSDDFENINSKY